MKDKRFFICLVLIISSIMVSCNWQLPEKVSVKTKADYNFSAGNLSISLDDALDIKKIMETGGSLPDKVKVYDYFPGQKDPNTQRYLIKVALAEIPLDLDSMMAKINLEENLKAMEFSKDIKVPTITIPKISQGFNIPGSEVLQSSGPISSVDIPAFNVSLKEILPASTGIKNCVIKDGSLGITIKGINPDADYTVTFNSTGGLVVDNKEGGKGSPISLADVSVKSGAPSTVTLTVKLTNVKSISNPTIEITPSITSIKSATVDLKEGIPTSFSKTVALPKEATDMVKSIQLKDSGFDMTYTNTLPDSNKIGFSAESKFLGITPAKTVEFKKGTFTENVVSNEKVTLADHSAGVDFTVGLTLPGAVKTGEVGNENTTSITVSDVTMGETYKIGFKITPKLDWTEVTVNPAALSGSTGGADRVKGDLDLNIDLNKMLKDFGKQIANDETLFTNIEFGKTPVYMFCSMPNVKSLEGLKFGGTAKLFAGSKEIGTILKNDDTLRPVGALPKLGDYVVIEDLANANSSVAPIELGAIINEAINNPGNLRINYDVGLNGGNDTDITIDKSELKGISKIALETYIDLGLALNIPKGSSGNGININLAKMETFKDIVKDKEGKPRDILNGAGKSIKDQGTDKYLTAVKSVSVNCAVGALPFVTDTPIKFVMKSNVGDWNLNLGQGQALDIALTNEQVEKLFNDPNNKDCVFNINEMSVTLPAGNFSIPRGKKVDTNLSLNLKTDGTIQVWEKGQNPDGASSSNGGNK